MFSDEGSKLLRLAVSHELGHAFCEELNEHRAEAYGSELRAGVLLTCHQLK
jgi:hypothetical protein